MIRSNRIVEIAVAVALVSSLLLSARPSARQRMMEQNQDEDRDSLVTLLSAQSMQLIEKDGMNWRKVTGPARFLHNNTYLICDTALWNVQTNVINAIGHVKILQEETVLTGDHLTYFIDDDLAQFRGTLVQLEDKDHNILRTNFLDYNTRDSVAVFMKGGSMKDKDGQIIESTTGTYDSKIKIFTFEENVNMFTDSIFVKTTSLVYDADRDFATFGEATDAWKDDGMLSSNDGWYDHSAEVFFFRDRVHGMSPGKEGWSDSLYFWRNSLDVEMRGNVQVTDSSRQVTALGGRLIYCDSLSQVFLSREAVVVARTEEEDSYGRTVVDSVWFGADSLYYRTKMRFQLDSSEVKSARQRLKDIENDAVTAYRRKAAEEAAKKAEEAAKNDPNQAAKAKAEAMKAQKAGPPKAEGADAPAAETADAPKADGPAKANMAEAPKAEKTAEAPKANMAMMDGMAPKALAKDSAIPAMKAEEPLAQRDAIPQAKGDSLSAAADSLAMGRGALAAEADTLSARLDSLSAQADSLKAVADSIARADSIANLPKDSTKVGFIKAVNRVRVFRKDMQIACDSLEYTDLDSLVRLYRKPLIWNDGNRQYAADSIFAMISEGAMRKANLMSNAFITVQEESSYFDQIRSTEMLAFFDSTSTLSRFDALGDASTIFYLKEDSTFTMINKSQAKMLSAIFIDGEIDNVNYFQDPKIDAYPIAQTATAERELKGFDWQPEKRPASRYDISPIRLRRSERWKYQMRPRASFKYTDIYFPGYMSGVYSEIRERDRRKREEERNPRPVPDAPGEIPDSLSTSADSIATVADSTLSVAKDNVSAASDSLKKVPSAKRDSLGTRQDSTTVTQVPKGPTKEELKAAKKAEKQAIAAEKQRQLELKWARLDSLDAAKKQAKIDKKQAKLREKKRKAISTEMYRQDKEDAKLRKFVEAYQKKREAMERRQARRPQKPKKPAKEKKPKPAPEQQPPEGEAQPVKIDIDINKDELQNES